MSSNPPFAQISRRALLTAMAAMTAALPPLSGPFLSTSARAQTAPGDPLPSWNDGPAKAAIIGLVKSTTDAAIPNFVPPDARIATFDQDGTTWVSHPIYTQVVYCLDRVPAVVKAKPHLKEVEAFKTVLSGDREEIAVATLTGITVDDFKVDVAEWIETAKHPPMLEVMKYLRENGYRTFIVTGGGQDFVRVYSQRVYGIPPWQVVGTAGGVKYGYDKDGKPFLTKEPRLLLNDNNAGKAEGIHLEIGVRPVIAFGNSTGDREMLEYTTGGAGARLGLLVLHDDAAREYAYGPARGLPDTRIGTFTEALYDEAKKEGWQIISMKNDWNRVFPFDERS